MKLFISTFSLVVMMASSMASANLPKTDRTLVYASQTCRLSLQSILGGTKYNALLYDYTRPIATNEPTTVINTQKGPMQLSSDGPYETTFVFGSLNVTLDFADMDGTTIKTLTVVNRGIFGKTFTCSNLRLATQLN